MAGKGKVEIQVNAEDNASGTLDKIGKKADEMGKKYAKAGKVMVGAGVAIIAGLGMAAKAAEAERVNVARLSATLDNVGVSYDNVKDSLESVILATQRKTGIADDQQRDALSELIITTNDYGKALSLLPLVLDFAAAKQIDLSTSAQIVGRVAEGNTTMLSRYGFQLDETTTASEALAMMQDRVAGSAEKMASPIDIMAASFSDLQESIGAALLPTLKSLMEWLTGIFDKIGAWAQANPQLIKTILAIAVALVGAGGLLVALSSISKAIIAVNTALAIMHGLSGPAGWIKLAAGIAIAGGAIASLNAMMGGSNAPTPTPEGPRPPSFAGG
ncbi:MAG: phage tail tape measure protein, partial [Gammaproteobacteria bacterium]|nr:phage tail tape measure protein [Gammaproteobacteria bacterium]